MIDLIKLRNAPAVSKRIYLLKEMSESMGTDVEFLFGLFNMYNEKNRGKWFWQKAAFTGRLKEIFERFNGFMDGYVLKIKVYSDDEVLRNYEEGKNLLSDLLKELETSLGVDREIDRSDVKNYLDENLRKLIQDNLKRVR